MKIKPEHLEHMSKRIALLMQKHPTAQYDYANGNFPRADKCKDINKRFRWDCFSGAGLSKFACEELYSYLNDSHIDTALRSIVEDIK